MENLLSYMLMALMMSMLPGADTVLIMKNTLSYGSKAGRFTILGVATGLTFWTVVAVLGLSVVIAQSVVLFNTIKYVGATYLIYLGVRVFFSKNMISLEMIETAKENAKFAHYYRESYWQGAITNILNPKTILVYITFMPQFINLSGHVNEQLVLLGLILTVIAVSWFLILVYLIDFLKKWLTKSKFQKIFQKFTGILLVGFGVKTGI